MSNPNQDHIILPASLAVKAMRDNGYRNTAYAIAELMDNSIQANAETVYLYCVEDKKLVNQRYRKKLINIAVLDDGGGMDSATLSMALQFGNSSRLDDRSGMGRFGMGLPNSSISQCKRLEVWTWKNGVDNALYSYLDIDEIEKGSMTTVPKPTMKPIPAEWIERHKGFGDGFAQSGTFILWNNLESHRISWRGAKATVRNTEGIIGRTYRKFIDEGKVRIHLRAIYEDGKPDSRLRINDPLYLMDNSTTPSFASNPAGTPMFKEHVKEEKIIKFDNKDHKITICTSWARDDTVPSRGDRGTTDYGKHTGKNIGLSILRAGRELELDQSWASSYDPTDRWWGAEIEFPPGLDELFGVTNNKQHAHTFTQLANFDWKSDAEEGEPKSDYLDRIKEEGDPRAILLPVADRVKKLIRELRKLVGDQTKGGRTKPDKRHEEADAATQATEKFKKRSKHHAITSDRTEYDPQEMQRALHEEHHYSDTIAKKISDSIQMHDKRVEFITSRFDDPYSFFKIEIHSNVAVIVFNENHPIHSKLYRILDVENIDEANGSQEENLSRIENAYNTFKLLFAAWARYELEEMEMQDKLKEFRAEWGKMAKYFLSEED